MSRENFIPAIAALASDFDKQADTAWLSDYRRQQNALLQQSDFPHSRVEHFKYNNLAVFDQQDFGKIAKIKPHSEDLTLDLRLIDGFSDREKTDRIVFVNGQYSATLSYIRHHRITCFADSNAVQRKKIITMLGQQDLTHNPFILLNAALTHQGVLVEIDENSPEMPIEVMTIVKPGAKNTTTATQVLFDVTDNAKATVIGRTISWDVKQQEAALSTVRTVVNVGKQASFTHYHLQLENPHSVHFGSIEYNLHTAAKLNAFYAATGGHLKKIDITVNHLGRHTYAGLNGLYVATDKQQVDYYTNVNHRLPNGKTDENFRGIINGSAKGVFNGRIHIYPDAQKTLAELSNKNLLLSNDATVHTKPELEIYADDVVCSHGATVSSIDSESLYYLLARGISKTEAELMLSFGFFNEILAKLDNQSIADYIRPILFKRFEDVMRGNRE
ncbi:MAG: Fe-S cluster assembly protein SufD [Gammaproteobacteria bacterium]|nr:MAG: Fe-S cluster assembly protein SufD [Gammaproteobacteria bacterium]